MTNLKRCLIGSLLAFAVITAGCAKKQDESTKKLEEVEKQLEETKKQLAEAQGQAPDAATQPGGAAQTGGAATGAAGQAMPGGQPAAPPPPPEPPKPKIHTVEAGTPISVRTLGAVSTKTSTTGTTFEATLAEPLIVDGYVVAPKGATAIGVVTSSDPGGKVKGVASIAVGLRGIVTSGGRRLDIKTSSVSQTAKQSKGKDAAKVGIGAGVGAAIGAIAGGGKGAAIGAGVGAAGGTGVVLATRGEPAVIPAESLLTFKLSAPITIEEKVK